MAKKLGIGQQLLHEHVAKLEHAGLVRREGDRALSLTTFGETIAGLIDTYLFLSAYKEYFSDHKFGQMPTKFARRIGDLSASTFVKGLSGVLERWRKVQDDAQEYIYMALPEVPSVMIEGLLKKLHAQPDGAKSLTVRCLYPRNIKTGIEGELKNQHFGELSKANLAKVRYVKNVEIAVVLNEKQSLVFFPNLRGETDMTCMFFGERSDVAPKSIRFHEWCLDYFRYRWHENDPVLLDSSMI